MRILAGKYKGKALKSFSNPSIRPTCGMVKEAVFNVCTASVEGARFLDVFAGVGSMGFEALSRGAASATFVDLSMDAIRFIRANSLLIDKSLPITIIRADARMAIQQLIKKQRYFDLIYLDPPYALDRYYLTCLLEDMVHGSLLAKEGQLFLENASAEPIKITGLIIKKQRKFGDTWVTEYLLEESS